MTLNDVNKNYKEKYGMTITEGDLDRAEKHIDLNREGGITVTEFMLGACSKASIITEANVKYVF